MTRQEKTDIFLLACFVVSLGVYVAIFASAFVELPLNIRPWHQWLLLFFHFVPLFFLQLLMCHMPGPAWHRVLPLALFLVPAVLFALCTGGALMGWILAGFWCVAPLLSCLCGWLVWGLVCLARRLRKPRA